MENFIAKKGSYMTKDIKTKMIQFLVKNEVIHRFEKIILYIIALYQIDIIILALHLYQSLPL